MRNQSRQVGQALAGIVGFSSLLAVGCGATEPPAVAPSPVPVAAPQAPAQAVPVSITPATVPAPPATEEVYAYSAAGRRDPFRSIIITGGKRNVEFLPPLQRREVSELKLVAVVWGTLGTYGMVELPDGKGYAVKIGTRVGPNQGVVRRITPKDLTVVERYVDFFGETRTREIVLELRTREEGLE